MAMKKNNTVYYSSFNSPVGELLLVGDGNFLHSVSLKSSKKALRVKSDWIKSDRKFAKAKKQISEYFKGKRKRFDLKIKFTNGTLFQKKVWTVLNKIPYGKTWSYQDIASKIGDKKAVRAVGSANGKNPFPIIIPCHRVIGKNGTLTGYSGGLKNKKLLLNLENIKI